MNRKWIYLALCGVLSAVSFFGCGGSTEGTNGEISGSVDSETTNSSVSTSQDSSHEHFFGNWSVTQEATCQRKGVKTRVCLCGEVEEMEIAIVDHLYGVDDKCVWCEKVNDNPTPSPAPDLTATITLTPYAGKEVDVLHPSLRSYIDQREDAKALAEILKAESSSAQSLIYQNLSFFWSATGSAPYTLSFADNQEFIGAYEHTVNATSCSDVGFFIPGRTYYWKVVSADGQHSKTDNFTVKNAIVRTITAGSMRNVRDMGGWSVGEGKRVAYGKLYRGDDPSFDAHGNEQTVKMMRYLGINGEIDVRLNSTVNKNFLDENKPFLNAGLKYFSQNLPNTTVGTWAETNGDFPIPLSVISQNVGKIFKFLANENNYPVYLHCTWGKDRTGTICYIIGGLLGMQYEDLMCDYELSSFANGVKTQPRNEIVEDTENGGWKFKDAKDDPWGHVGRMHYDIAQNYPSATQAESIAKYLKQECGVTDAEIAKVRENLTERI